MTREDIENNVGYWQGKANLEYIRQRQEHGVNDPYMITEIDEAFDAGYDKGYQYAVDKACEWLEKNMFEKCEFDEYGNITQTYACSDSCDFVSEFVEQMRKAMEE